ncbi:hypothetical protein [Streptomyces racemochromogenes]|uniref:hypothetical protein n=1 Tax=Streptomyces racemochromogenes TaxID=67353 RepID=UPI0035EEFDFF
MYSLRSGYRLPGVQRGLSPVERLLTKANAGLGGALLASTLLTPPPMWTLGAVAGAAAVLNVAPGPRSVARWVAVGYRYLRERTVPAAMTDRPGATESWHLYPDHGTMQDPHRRAAWHDAFAATLVLAATQARQAGIQVHVTHHADVTDCTAHTQTVSVHIPRGLVGQPDRVIARMEAEFSRLGVLTPLEPEPVPTVTERGAAWVCLDGDHYASTARITGWPDETDGKLMGRLLLGDRTQTSDHYATDRSLSVLYRPLPPGQSRRSAQMQDAAAGAFTTNKIKQAEYAAASGGVLGELVDGATLVDIDAYMTVWGDSPEAVADARWQADLAAGLQRVRLDWLTGQQHRAHLMTSPHGASTAKGAVL